ncbi:MAG: secondary thiamine-phosphate synthase enzyme [Cyclobacteriaceae bacterium]|jgi:secondary thiamine-phosphate synthase enzyme
MGVFQQKITLQPKARGHHLITHIVSEALENSHVKNGMAHLHILHTSASLTINENADPTVRIDFETFLSEMVPENYTRFLHTYEGSDDMPAHIKSSLLGNNITIPIQNRKLVLGTWQGIYFGEHRDNGGARQIFISVIGE